MLIAEDSPLRKLPLSLSRKQVLVFDGIRYSADMAFIAYQRLYESLQATANNTEITPSVRDIACAMLDAWSIIDATHRLRRLVDQAPGLSNTTWKTLFLKRTTEVEDLRNCVQHQLGELSNLVNNAGQIWGYLSWAEVKDGKHTGKWLMMAPGAVYAEDKFLFIGPVRPKVPVLDGHIRLNAFGKQVYLGTCIMAINEVIRALEKEIHDRNIKLIGSEAIGRNGGDIVYEGGLLVITGKQP